MPRRHAPFAVAPCAADPRAVQLNPGCAASHLWIPHASRSCCPRLRRLRLRRCDLCRHDDDVHASRCARRDLHDLRDLHGRRARCAPAPQTAGVLLPVSALLAAVFVAAVVPAVVAAAPVRVRRPRARGACAHDAGHLVARRADRRGGHHAGRHDVRRPMLLCPCVRDDPGRDRGRGHADGDRAGRDLDRRRDDLRAGRVDLPARADRRPAARAPQAWAPPRRHRTGSATCARRCRPARGVQPA